MADVCLVRETRVGVVAITVLALVACGRPAQPQDSDEDEEGTTAQAVFTNPDFESDPIGNAPAGWTIQSNLNPAFTDTRPNTETLPDLNLTSGGVLLTSVVGGAPESQTDPDLGTNGTFRFPKYGNRAARVNYGDATTNGKNKNVNILRQTMTVGLTDVDPLDGKVHIRFTVAPLLEDPSHNYTQQPYYFVRLQNVTTNTTLYSEFNIVNSVGVPWKQFTDASANPAAYVDWALDDIAPGTAGVQVGDQVELLVLAAGCSRGGHWGRIYVDSFGENIPGLYTWSTGPQVINAGGSMTYRINYRNGGTATTAGTHIDFVTPPNTTFVSTTGASCTTPSVGATGTVTCQLGTLAPNADGSYSITVNVPSATATSTVITNGNYSIAATNVSPLLGSKVFTTVTAAGTAYADLQVAITDGKASVPWGQPTSYTITVSNAGPIAASSVSVADTMPAQLTGVTWTCAATGGATCTAAGSGNLGDTIAVPVGATATYTINATVIAGSGVGSIRNAVTATVRGAQTDPDTSSNSAADITATGDPRVLTTTKATAAALGTIRSTPAGLTCDTTCTSTTGVFVDGATVLLSASPVTGATFVGWTGACSGTGTCSVTMSSAVSVGAIFAGPPANGTPSGASQTTLVTNAFAQPLSVVVTDSAGTPVPGVTVTFAVPGSGASAMLGATTAITDATGTAQVTATANATPGAFTATATIPGIATPVSFALDNLGPPTSVAVVSGSGQSATVATGFTDPLIVEVRDAANQLLPNIAVTFTAPATGASATPSPTTVLTGPDGQGSLAVAANTIAGGYTIAASVSGVATPASFSLTNTAGAPATVSVVSGDGQSATVNTAFSAPLVAEVTDAFGNPVPGATVTFTPPTTGATATVSTPALTDVNGQTSVTATAGTAAGSFTITAATAGAASATFTATATPGAPASITVTSGDGQTPTVNTVFAAPLAVTVRDAFGNPVPGVTVGFSAPGSGASASVPPTATTGADGVAAITPTAGTVAGTVAITASVTGVPTASFTATNLAGTAASIGVQSGAEQSTAVTTAFPLPLVAVVTDAFGNPVVNAQVSFSAPSTGARATLSPITTTTNAAGQASTTATAGTVTGGFDVTATLISGGGGTTTFGLTNTAGAPTAIAVVSGTPQTQQVNTAFAAPVVVEVRDAFGNLVSGAPVTFTAPATGATATPSAPTANSGKGGHAQVTVTAGTVIGSYNLIASIAAGPSVSFALTNTAGPPATVAVVSGTPQSAQVDAAFAQPLVAIVHDAFGNLVTGASVTFTPPGSGATAVIGTATVVTGSDGLAQVSATAGTQTGAYTVTAGVDGATSASFALTNTAGPAATITAISGGEQSAQVATAFAAPLIVEVRDAHGNLVPNATVSFSAPASGASATVTATATTGNDGRAQITPTAGTVAGSYQVTASAGGANATFPLINTAGPASQIVIAGGDGQSTAVTQGFAQPLTVTATDSFGNPIAGVVVTWQAPDPRAPTAQLADVVVTTGADGTAATTAIAGFHAGSIAITATGAGATATFHETSVAGPPATIAALPESSPQAAQVSQAFAQPLAVIVEDEFGNPCAATSVAFASAANQGGGVILSAPTAVTDASGIAHVAATATGTVGGTLLTATVTGLAPATFGLVNLRTAPLTITASAGSGQSATVDTDFIALDALVTDGGGQPVASASVTFSAPATGATAQLAATTVATDANGHATLAVHAGTIAGGYQIFARVAHAAAPAAFALTNAPGAPVAIVTSPLTDAQTATINTAYAAALDAEIVDAFGNGVPGVTVTFSAPVSGASGTLAAPSVVTDATGHAQTTISANAAVGEFAVSVAADGVPTTSFALANISASPVRLSVKSGAPQAAIVATGFPQPLVAHVVDGNGNPLVGVAVTFTAPATGASVQLAPATAFTDANGGATTFVTAGDLAGTVVVTATTPQGAATIAFTIVTQAGAPLTATLIPSSTPQATQVGDLFTAPLAIVITDAFGNPVPGVPVTYTAPTVTTNATSLLGAIGAVSDNNGIVTSLALANSHIGTYTVTAEVSDLTELSFSLTNLAGAPNALVAISGGGQHALATAGFTAPVVMRVVDAFGNPLAGVTVTLSVPTTGASGALTTTTATSDEDGLISTMVTANGAPGSFSVVGAIVAGLSVSVGLIVDAIPTTTAITLPSTLPVNHDIGADIAVTAVLGTPAGAVDVLDNTGAVLGTATLDAAGHAHVTGALHARGTHTLSARFRAQGMFAASNSASSTIALTDDDGELTGAGTDCNSAGGHSGFALLVLAAALIIRPRRRRALGITGAILAALAVLVAPRLAAAQAVGSRAIDRLEPAAAESEWFALDSLSFAGHVAPAIAITGDYGYRPLVIYNADTSRRANIDRNQLVLHFAGSLSLFDRLRLAANVPASPFQNGESATFNGMQLVDPTFAFGDITLAADLRVAGTATGPFRVAVGGSAILPTGSRTNYMSDGIFAGDAHVLVAGTLGMFEYAAEGHTLLRECTQLAGDNFGSEARYGAAVGVRLARDRLVIGPELFGAFALGSNMDTGRPIEVGGSLHYRFSDSFHVGAGATAGLIHAVGTPEQRGMLSFSWVP
jgi:uncharacterized repeat protein (TIGR01451 family)